MRTGAPSIRISLLIGFIEAEIDTKYYRQNTATVFRMKNDTGITWVRS